VNIRGLTVVHKYSNNYKNSQVWPALDAHQDSNPFTVDYNTGFLTTGRDWWFVSWVSNDLTEFHYSDPQNFQEILNFLEQRVAPAILEVIGSILGGAVVPSPLSPVGAALGNAVGVAVSQLLLNREGTGGFKQHILRKEDRGQITRITLNPGRTISIRSNSGSSETGWSTKRL
jgi:hypothetical protein